MYSSGCVRCTLQIGDRFALRTILRHFRTPVPVKSKPVSSKTCNRTGTVDARAVPIIVSVLAACMWACVRTYWFSGNHDTHLTFFVYNINVVRLIKTAFIGCTC